MAIIAAGRAIRRSAVRFRGCKQNQLTNQHEIDKMKRKRILVDKLEGAGLAYIKTSVRRGSDCFS